MRIQDGVPIYLQLNVHTFGALYEYSPRTETFEFLSGENLTITDGISMPVVYPETVNTINGHPEIFVSNGSHGNWATPGKQMI